MWNIRNCLLYMIYLQFLERNETNIYFKNIIWLTVWNMTKVILNRNNYSLQNFTCSYLQKVSVSVILLSGKSMNK